MELGKPFLTSKRDYVDKDGLLIVPLFKEPFERTRHPYFQIQVNEAFSGDTVELSLETHVVAYVYSTESVQKSGDSIKLLRKLTPPAGAPIALDKIGRRLSKNEWDSVNKELIELQTKAAGFVAEAKSSEAPDDAASKEEQDEYVQLKTDIDYQIKSHEKQEFSKLLKSVEQIQKQIAGATLSLKLSLDVKDGDRTIQVILAEVDGATE